MTDRPDREEKTGQKTARTPVQLKISGIQTGTGQDQTEPVVLVVRGEYFCKEKTHYIFYTEFGEDGEKTRNRLTFRPGQVELRKHGQGRSRLTFEQGRMLDCHYHTVVGPMNLVSDTRRIHWEEEENNRRLYLEYSLLMNGQVMADYELTVEMVLPRERE